MSFLSAALALLAFVGPNVCAQSVATQDTKFARIGIDQNLNKQVPLDLAFRDETGKRVLLRDYFGKRPVILALVYYECPMLCTETLNGLVRALRAVSFDAGKEFSIVTVSFDPKETPLLAAAKKNIYVERYGRPSARNGWAFLTGEGSSIRPLADAVGFHYLYDSEAAQYLHATGVMVLTPGGVLSRYFYGVEYSARDMRLALVEAAQGKIGSPVDRILLYCYHYDPLTGKYGLLILRILRLAGVGTAAALAAFVILAWRRERLQILRPGCPAAAEEPRARA